MHVGKTKCYFSSLGCISWSEMETQIRPIFGLQPRDKAALLGVNKINLYPKNLHENRFQFQEKRNVFVLDSQHGQRDVTCKLADVS